MTTPVSPADRYENPLSVRYASAEMSTLFSARSKFATWRRLWLWLAESEKELGLPIPDAALVQLREHLVPGDAELSAADRYERDTKHDVMAHLHALGDVAPAAKGVLHLGATSAFVGDNADLLLLREALRLLARRTVRVMGQLAAFARKWRDLPCLGFTHFQAAQPTTVGKRACLWLQDLSLDHRELTRRAEELRFLGCKGATGTQASFVALFDGDVDKADRTRQARRRKGRLPWAAPRLRTDLHPQAGRPDPLRPRGARGLRLEVRKRPPAPPAPEGGRGAVRRPAGRLVGDALQAEPDEGRADQRPRALAPRHGPERRLDSRHAVVRTDARRLGEPPPRPPRVLPRRRLDPSSVGGGRFGARRPRERRPSPPRPGASLSRDGEHPDGGRPEGGRPAEGPRADSRRLAGRGRPAEGPGGPNDLLERIAEDPGIGLTPAEIAAAADPARFIGRAPEQVDEFLAAEIDPILAENAEILRGDAAEVPV